MKQVVMKPHSQEKLGNMCWELCLGLKTISVAQCFTRSEKDHLDDSYIFKDKESFVMKNAVPNKTLYIRKWPYMSWEDSYSFVMCL